VDIEIFERRESNVRSYCREFPAIFSKASGPLLWDTGGNRYLDFLSGAGALNYGHNHPTIRSAVISYLEKDGIVHALDLFTEARAAFLTTFEDVVLTPRGLDYRVQFPGPTGTNAVEAALKLARKITGRASVVAFTNAFHGMSLGALAASATARKRTGAGLPLSHITRMPFDGYMGMDNTAEFLERTLDDPGSGVDLPAAIIVETVQAEGGVQTAQPTWLRAVADIARRHDVLLIVDEIQTGCGRTGPFFSFERANISPDIVCLSKSLSGLGLPLSAVLIKPQYDVWAPGEHNGTFRGNNMALVAATAALTLWRDGGLVDHLKGVLRVMDSRILDLAKLGDAEVRGVGALRGIRWQDPTVARNVSRMAFARGLIAETCGAQGDVLKLLPPLTIDTSTLDHGFDILEEAARGALSSR